MFSLDFLSLELRFPFYCSLNSYYSIFFQFGDCVLLVESLYPFLFGLCLFEVFKSFDSEVKINVYSKCSITRPILYSYLEHFSGSCIERGSCIREVLVFFQISKVHVTFKDLILFTFEVRRYPLLLGIKMAYQVIF